MELAKTKGQPACWGVRSPAAEGSYSLEFPHSLRHNFATALNDQTPRSRMKSQLLGHTRGTTLGDVRYTDDITVDALVGIVNDCKFDMPVVQEFDIDEGIAAVRQALRLKDGNLRPRNVGDRG